MSANLQACAFLLARLQKEVDRLQAVAFPGHHTGPRKWLNFVSGLLDTASGYLGKARDPVTGLSERSQLIQEAERLGNSAYKLLKFVAGVDSTQIPHQVVAPFQRWVEALGITQTIFFRAEHAPNYEIATIDYSHASLLNDASKSLVDATAAIEWPVLRVSMPGHAMGLLPHFAVVGHELGHAIESSIKPDFSGNTQDISDFRTRLTARLASDGITLGPDDDVAAAKILASWVSELKADAVGHYLVGPGFFFALCGFLELSGQGYGVGSSHPPSDLRRKLLFERLVAGADSFADVLRARTGLVLTEELNSPHIAKCLTPDEMFIELKQVMDVPTAAICTELPQVLTALAPKIFDAAHKHLASLSADLVYTSLSFSTDLDRHLELLCQLVPPIEYRDSNGLVKASKLSSIMNVGWATLLTRVARFPTGNSAGDPEAAQMECLHELLLKAVELSEARQLWEELQ